MSSKTKNIIGWVISGLLALVFLGSAAMKLLGGDAGASAAAAMGLSGASIKIIALVEIASIVLFTIPRTGLLGTLLLAAYMGGAIATHLEHEQPIFVPVIVAALVWITALVRFPELGSRLGGNTNLAGTRHTQH